AERTAHVTDVDPKFHVALPSPACVCDPRVRAWTGTMIPQRADDRLRRKFPSRDGPTRVGEHEVTRVTSRRPLVVPLRARALPAQRVSGEGFGRGAKLPSEFRSDVACQSALTRRARAAHCFLAWTTHTPDKEAPMAIALSHGGPTIYRSPARSRH